MGGVHFHFPRGRSLDIDIFVPDSVLPRGFPRRRASLVYECLNRVVISCLHHEKQKEMKQNRMKKSFPWFSTGLLICQGGHTLG